MTSLTNTFFSDERSLTTFATEASSSDNPSSTGLVTSAGGKTPDKDKEDETDTQKRRNNMLIASKYILYQILTKYSSTSFRKTEMLTHNLNVS